MSTPILFNPTQGPSSSTDLTKRPAVLLAQYGDGYEQRLADGINPRRLEAKVVWSALTHANATNIRVFFDARGGVEPFLYTLEPDTIQRRWVCPEYVRTEIAPKASSITATFREVFDL